MLPPEARQRIERLQRLLKIERDEDFRQYQEQFLRVKLEKRKQNGLTWYPVKINAEELSSHELLLLEIERTALTDHPHQFSSGKNVSLFSANQEDVVVYGTVKSVSKNSLKLIVNLDELPDWCYDGKLGLNIQFDENSYQEMQKALGQLLNTKNKAHLNLLHKLEGLQTLVFNKDTEDILVPGLNLSQNRAIRHALSAEDLAVVHGPPGTGKTSSLVWAIYHCLKSEQQVLVCAPTNTAVDLLAEKLNAIGVDVLRLGHPARVSEDLQACSLEGKLTASKHYKELRQLRRNAEEYFRMAGKYKRVFGPEEARQRSTYYAEAKSCIREARLLEDLIEEELFNSAQVICCTPVASTHRGLARKKFKTLFFDEASQCLEPMVWIPLLRCERLILFGDHFQLPPVVKSAEAKKGGLDESLLDRCIVLDSATVLLNRQYRMNKVIMGFSNAWFYKDELKADETVKEQVLAEDETAFLNRSLEFIDTAGCGFEEEQNPESLSYRNPSEGRILFQHLQDLLGAYAAHSHLPLLEIGLIAPYREQRDWLSANYPDSEIPQEKIATLEIKTIDGFQGEECDVIYISMVRSNAKKEIGFLADERRMNVALTRARKKLVLIGDSSTLGVNPFFRTLLEYCETQGQYRSAWEWMKG
ncbi:MAG TPA: AAA domain-containing protein [Bacteroidia bacterium]|nr:AAA domain-containing protein [Bacteroidia bacterium]